MFIIGIGFGIWLQAGEGRAFPWGLLGVLFGLIALGWFLTQADRRRHDRIPPTGRPQGADATVAPRVSEFESDEMEARVQGGEGGAPAAQVDLPEPEVKPPDGEPGP